MASSPNGGQTFQVHASQVIAKELRRIQRRATQEGRGETVLSALRAILQGLTLNPRRFGEPLYNLPNLRLQIRSVVVLPISMHFAVSQTRPDVYIKGVELLDPPAS